MDTNKNPNRDKSRNKKPAIADPSKAFTFFGTLMVLLTAIVFLDSLASRGIGVDEIPHLSKLTFPLIGISVLSLILVVRNFSHRLKQLEAR